MGKVQVILKKDFEVDSLSDLSKLLNGPDKTEINYKTGKDKINMATRLSIMSLPMLFAITVISLGLPVVEFILIDAVGFLALMVVDALFICFFDHVEDLFITMWWMLIVACCISYYHYITLVAWFNLLITWMLLRIWDYRISNICKKELLICESNFVDIWMGRVESIKVGGRKYIHKVSGVEIEEAIRRDEIIEKDKDRLAYFDREFMSRFGMYTNPKTGKNIQGAQDYYEALEATDGRVPDRGKLTSTELDELFAKRFSDIYRTIRGMKDYLLVFDEQQRQQTVRSDEPYSKVKFRMAVDEDEDEEEEEIHDKEYYIDQLNSLVGMDSIKKDVQELINLVQMQQYRKENGLKDLPVSLHLVFMGNPGTGKTTVARILAKLYRAIGVLEKGQLVETDRADLVAGYVGQTALKTKEKIEEAMGGVLFIDEAYTLNKEGNDFGQEAIDTILKAMEDHRDKFIVIVAGYPELMNRFINSNPGLKSRFNKYFMFPDYTDDELYTIFNRMCEDYDYIVGEDADMFIRSRIIELERKKGDNFANARDVRNMFERIISNQATRVMNTNGLTSREIMTITEEDL